LRTIPVELGDLALAATLIVINGGLSVALQLGLERQLAIATARMIVQLALVGVVLTTLFSHVPLLWTGLAALVMVLFAGREIMARQERRLAGLWSYGLGTGLWSNLGDGGGGVSSVMVEITDGRIRHGGGYRRWAAAARRDGRG
jgi:ABC-type iron transport system FetAB permease component